MPIGSDAGRFARNYLTSQLQPVRTAGALLGRGANVLGGELADFESALFDTSPVPAAMSVAGPAGSAARPGLPAQPTGVVDPRGSVLDDVASAPSRPVGLPSNASAIQGFRDRQPESFVRPLLQTGGTGLSMADIAGRKRAMGALDDLFGSEEDLRPDPMGDAIAARKRTLEYEGLQPYGALSSIAAKYGAGHPLQGLGILHTEGDDPTGTRPMGEPTRAEEFQIRQQQQRQAPDYLKARAEAGKSAAEGGMLQRRAAISDELMQLREELNAEVQSGQRSPQDAAALFQKKAQEAAVFADLMKTGVSARPRDGYMDADAP